MDKIKELFAQIQFGEMMAHDPLCSEGFDAAITLIKLLSNGATPEEKELIKKYLEDF